MRKHFLLLASLIVFSFKAEAQLNQESRVEFEVSYSENDFEVIPAGETGVLLYRQADENKRDDRQTWEFKLFSTEFKESWSKTYDFPSNFRLSARYANGNRLFLLFNVKYGKGEQQLVRLTFDELSLQIDTFSFFLPQKYTVSRFMVSGEHAYFHGVIKRTDVLSDFDLSSKKFKLIPNVHAKYVFIEDMQADEQKKNINIVFRVKQGKKMILYLQQYHNGEMTEQAIIIPDDIKYLRDAKIAYINDNSKVVIGTYSIPKAGLQGFYFAGVDSTGKQKFIRYHNFTEFKNLLSMYKARSREKIEKKVVRKKNRGKEVSLVENILLHNIIEHNNQYLVFGEIYYATYRTEYYPCTVGNMRSTCTRSVFDGWAYLMTAIAAFDKEGNHLWDQVMEMNDYKSYSLKEVVKISFDGDKIIMAYGNGTVLKSKVLEGSIITEGKRTALLSSGKESDKIKRSTSDMEYWYGSYFVVWGSQKIKNKEEKTKRYVFYFSKAGY